MAVTLSSFQMGQGDQAPDFILPDTSGALHSRSEIAGKNGLLIVFACNHCPFVIHLAKQLGSFAREIADLGVKTVAINSNDFVSYPEDAPDRMKAFSAENGWEFPYLVDESQQIAKAYKATCTPDFFLFDGNSALFYAGQFDGSRPGSGHDANGADLRESVRKMLGQERPLARPYPSSGCNIKWKSGAIS